MTQRTPVNFERNIDESKLGRSARNRPPVWLALRPGKSANVLPNFRIDKWKSEREQIHQLKAREAGTPSRGLILYVDERNIDYLESASCGEIVSDLQSRVDAAYRSIPSSAELMAHYGDSNRTRIYGMQLELDSLWLDRCLRVRDIYFERRLTHLH
jgi:hypothetical protein